MVKLYYYNEEEMKNVLNLNEKEAETMKEKELHNGSVPFLNCKDHFVSGETYEVMINDKLDMLVTSPIPPAQDLNVLIEDTVRKAPEQYLWLHRRFKTRPEGDPNPYKDI